MRELILNSSSIYDLWFCTYMAQVYIQFHCRMGMLEASKDVQKSVDTVFSSIGRGIYGNDRYHSINEYFYFKFLTHIKALYNLLQHVYPNFGHSSSETLELHGHTSEKLFCDSHFILLARTFKALDI